MSATKAIHAKCLDCCLGDRKEVRLCVSKTCALYSLRLGKGNLKAIREYCLGCGEAGWKAVKNCKQTDCSLYPYRLGKNPNRKLKLTEEERKDRANRLAQLTLAQLTLAANASKGARKNG
jgi:hypothetical protein